MKVGGTIVAGNRPRRREKLTTTAHWPQFTHDDERHEEHKALERLHDELCQSWQQSQLSPSEWYSQASPATRGQLHLFLLTGRSLGRFSAADLRKRVERYNLPDGWSRDGGTIAPPTTTGASLVASNDERGQQQRHVTWSRKRSVHVWRRRTHQGEQSLIGEAPPPSKHKDEQPLVGEPPSETEELSREASFFQRLLRALTMWC